MQQIRKIKFKCLFFTQLERIYHFFVTEITLSIAQHSIRSFYGLEKFMKKPTKLIGLMGD